MNKETDFDIYVNKYKKLPLQEKKKMVNQEMKRLLAFIEKTKTDMGIHDKLLLNKELLDLNSEFVSDDDFVEAMFVYTYSIQESLGKYFNEVSKRLYK